MKVAIIGFGSVGKRHLKNLLDMGIDCVIVSSHLSGESINVGGKTIPIASELESVINEVDAAVISNATSLHLKYLSYLIGKGKHIYVEKPVSCSSKGLSELVSLALKKKLVVTVGTQFRFNSKLKRLKHLIEKDHFGKILAVFSSHGEYIGDYHPEEDYRKSYSVDPSCGGVLLTQIHHIDYLNWLFGPFDLVYANNIHFSDLGVDCESVVNYSLVKEDSKLQIQGHMNYVQRNKSTWLRLIGEYGTAYWDYEKKRLEVDSIKGSFCEVSKQERNEMFVAAIESFIEVIHSQTPSQSSFVSGIESVQIVDAIKRSSTDGLVSMIDYGVN